jgi:hypothetical protein
METHSYNLIARIGDFDLKFEAAQKLSGRVQIITLNVLLEDRLKAGDHDNARKVAKKLIELG